MQNKHTPELEVKFNTGNLRVSVSNKKGMFCAERACLLHVVWSYNVKRQTFGCSSRFVVSAHDAIVLFIEHESRSTAALPWDDQSQ